MKTSIPKLRFIEFKDAPAWEEKKLGVLTSLKKGPFGSSLKKDMFVQPSNNTYKVYEQKNAIRKDCNLGDYYISEEDYNKLKGFEVYTGDIIVSCAGTIGEIYELPNGIERGIINQALMIARVNEKEIDKVLFLQKLNSLIKRTSNQKSNGSAIKNIPPLSDLRDATISLGNIEEQHKIGKFLSILDKRIELQEKLIEKLEEEKKGYLQKLFPKKGKNIPELRFEEFKDAPIWEEKKLGELGTFEKGKGISKSEIDIDGQYKCIQYGELFTKYGRIITSVFSATNNMHGIVSKKGDLLFPTSDVTPNGLATSSVIQIDNVIIGGDIIKFRSANANNIFVSYNIESRKYDYLRLVSGSTVYHIYEKDIATFKIHFGSKQEQSVISSSLSYFDERLSSMEKMCSSLKSKKEYYLSKIII